MTEEQKEILDHNHIVRNTVVEAWELITLKTKHENSEVHWRRVARVVVSLWSMIFKPHIAENKIAGKP